MRASWFEGVAAGAFLAVSSLALGSAAAETARPAFAGDQAAIEAAVPLPEPAGLPPPSIADLEPATTGSLAEQPAQADKRSAPDPAPAAPSTASDPASEAGPRPASAASEGGAPAAPANAASLGAAPADAAAPPSPGSPASTEQAQVPPAAPDAPLRTKLAELIGSGKLDRLGKRDRAAVEDFYKGRQFAPLWIADGAPSERMKAAVARLKEADADGLEAKDYPTPDPATLGSDNDALARAELKLTATVLKFAREAEGGRVAPSRISTTNIEYAVPAPDPADVLKRVSEASDVAAALAAFNPPHPGFQALRAKLAELRNSHGSATSAVTIPSGPTLREGMHDRRVPLLRERLGLASLAGDTEYDVDLVDAVKGFQRSKGLSAKGALNAATVETLNRQGNNRGEIETIVSNMERWRWLPRELGAAYVMVNIPDFTLKVVRNGAAVFGTRIVVGKPETPTPIFSDAIENIVVNPTWHVPQSIIYNEYLPALERDPDALERMGLTLKHERDGTISVTQPPGERNALGRMKFNFPNRFNVYLHDTPTKHLFAQERRAYSHGCMRVQNPTELGQVLLSLAGAGGERFSADHLQRMFGQNERWLKFKPFIPVHLTYMNAFVDENGRLVIRDDLYGLDARVKAALRGDPVPAEHVAEAKPERRRGRAFAEERRPERLRPERVASTPRPPRRIVRQQMVYEQPRPQPQPGSFFFPFFQ